MSDKQNIEERQVPLLSATDGHGKTNYTCRSSDNVETVKSALNALKNHIDSHNSGDREKYQGFDPSNVHEHRRGRDFGITLQNGPKTNWNTLNKYAKYVEEGVIEVNQPEKKPTQFIVAAEGKDAQDAIDVLNGFGIVPHDAEKELQTEIEEKQKSAAQFEDADKNQKVNAFFREAVERERQVSGSSYPKAIEILKARNQYPQEGAKATKEEKHALYDDLIAQQEEKKTEIEEPQQEEELAMA